MALSKSALLPLILSAAILSGCGTSPLILEPERPEALPPSDALVPCPQALPELPHNLGELPIAEALQVLLETKLRSDTAYRECKNRHDALRKYVRP